MAKQINFEYDGKKYCLEFTRDTIRRMEMRGFVADQIADKPTLMIPQLFAGAFLAHHKHLPQAFIDDLYEEFVDKDKLLNALVEMYSEPVSELFGSGEDANKGKKIKWEQSF